MLKFFTFFISIFISFSIFASTGYGQQVIENVINADGDAIGSVWTDRDLWTFECADKECTGETNPIVCMEYSNDCLAPIVCNLEVSALLAEPFTGFVKVVTDVRDEIVFFNQTHKVCFDFSKDVYNLWTLLDTSDPKINCTPYVEQSVIISSM